MKNGAVSVRAPTKLEDEHGFVITAAIKTFGDTIHTFIDRSNYNGLFLPGYVPHPAKEPFNKVMP